MIGYFMRYIINFEIFNSNLNAEETSIFLYKLV